MSDEGLMLYAVARAEMVEHLQARHEYHAKRAEALMTQAELEDQKARDSLSEADTVSDRMDIKASSNYTNVIGQRDQLRARARGHVKSAAFFKWAVDHVPDGGVDFIFKLNRHELQQLEFFPD